MKNCSGAGVDHEAEADNDDEGGGRRVDKGRSFRAGEDRN